MNIQVYGTHEEPLFKAKDIGDLLDIKNIRDAVATFNNKQRRDVGLTDAMGREQRTTFLTEQGLYKVIMRSRKKIAEAFQDWVCEVVEEIRKKGKFEIEEQLRMQLEAKEQLQKQLQEKEQELLQYKEKTYEEIEKTGHIYVIKTDGGIKVGKTKDIVQKRVKGLQTGNVDGKILADGRMRFLRLSFPKDLDFLKILVQYDLSKLNGLGLSFKRDPLDTESQVLIRHPRTNGSLRLG